ncbi:MAG: AAA-like domain protein [Promethearchaeota archaeon]|nr:MAG: AAA-like domain protein [Candidatus Lokiarchaeota archaeon]
MSDQDGPDDSDREEELEENFEEDLDDNLEEKFEEDEIVDLKDEDDFDIEEKPIGRLVGKTQISEARVLIESDKVERTSYLVVYGKKRERGERDYKLLTISSIWNDSQGLKADLQVIGERPTRPFDVGAKVYLAKDEQIRKVLGIENPPDKSIALGKLLGYDFKVNLMVKDFGRVFITGRSGSGKSYTMGVLCEEFMKKGVPVVILDRHGEYGSLKIKSEDDGAGESPFINNIIEFSDLSINKGADVDIEYLFSLGESDIVAPNLCAIINMRGLSLEAQESLAGRLLKKLYKASTSRKIPPFYLFLDEAHLFAGKKSTETCETVKLFSQEGRKFGANMVIGTQRPQLLDTTIRAQAGTWVVHCLSDVNDVNITIHSAEDLSKEHRTDISGLDKGEAIISGEAVSGIPLFVKVRKRETQHGGIGFNALDYLSEQTVEDLQKRKQRILGNKSEAELEAGKEIFMEVLGDKSRDELLDMVSELKMKVRNLENEVSTWKERFEKIEEKKGIISSDMPVDERIKELQTDLTVWKEKYKALKNKVEAGGSDGGGGISEEALQKIHQLEKYTKELEAKLNETIAEKDQAIRIAEKTIAEYKKLRR